MYPVTGWVERELKSSCSYGYPNKYFRDSVIHMDAHCAAIMLPDIHFRPDGWKHQIVRTYIRLNSGRPIKTLFPFDALIRMFYVVLQENLPPNKISKPDSKYIRYMRCLDYRFLPLSPPTHPHHFFLFSLSSKRLLHVGCKSTYRNSRNSRLPNSWRAGKAWEHV